MRLRGSGVKPSISFDMDHISMPIVPLNVRSRTRFYVLNHGYPALELQHKLPSYTPVQVELSYPEGEEPWTLVADVTEL
jgi:hypothetical protein